MKRLILIGLLAAPAGAGEYPSRVERIGAGGDSVEIMQITADHARLTYSNSGDESSRGAVVHVQAGQIVVAVEINVKSGPEEITVTPSGSYIAIPSEGSIEDGDTLTVDIMLPMF